MGKGNGKTDGNIKLQSVDLRARGFRARASGRGRRGRIQRLPRPRRNLRKLARQRLSETEKLKAERDALLDRLARLQAEFDNARKRAVREQQDFREYAAAEVIKGLLPTLDSFERALKAGGDSTDFRNGIELIYRQFQDALQKIGVQPIVSVGQPFDPRIHEAIEMVDTTEIPDHHVLDELQRGYKYKERLLRPAMVRVARNTGA